MRNYIKFLGTAGARHVVARQLRSSGGVFISMNGKKIILDPGPGTLVKCAESIPKIEVTELDGVILTHNHIDHANDVNILIDAMTGGGIKKRGMLFAPAESLEGDNAVVLKYLRDFLSDIKILQANHRYFLDGLSFSTSIRHRHPVQTYGIQFHFGNRKVSFMTDTRYFPELAESYKDSSILIINVVLYAPPQHEKIMHLSADDVKEILSAVKPGKTVLTHFGRTMLMAGPEKVAADLRNELDMDVVAASDGMIVDLDKEFGDE